MINIIQLTPDLDIGGMQNFVMQHEKYLSEQGYSNSVLCWFRCDCPLNNNYDCLNGSSIKDLLSYFRFRSMIKSEMKNSENLIIHSHGITLLLSLFIIDLLIRQKISWVHTIHNMVQNEAGSFRRIIWYIMFRFFRVHPVVISNMVYESFLKYYKNIESVSKITNKIDISRFNNISKVDQQSIVRKLGLSLIEKRIIVVGRYDKQKNISALLELIASDLNMWGFQYVFCISDDQRKPPDVIDKLLCELKDNVNVQILYNRRDIHEIMSVCDYYLSFSLFEGLPLTLMEAMSAGCSPIITPTGGAHETVGSFGFVSPDFTNDAFIKTFKQGTTCFRNRDEIAEHSKIKFEYKTCGSAYVNLYRTKATRT